MTTKKLPFFPRSSSDALSVEREEMQALETRSTKKVRFFPQIRASFSQKKYGLVLAVVDTTLSLRHYLSYDIYQVPQTALIHFIICACNFCVVISYWEFDINYYILILSLTYYVSNQLAHMVVVRWPMHDMSYVFLYQPNQSQTSSYTFSKKRESR